MSKMYVVSGKHNFADLNDAIKFAKESLFEKISKTNAQVMGFSMQAKSRNRIIIKAGVLDDWTGYKRKTITIRVIDITPPQFSLEVEYSQYKRYRNGK